MSFDFDLDYSINNVRRRAPGRGVYTFVRSGQAGGGGGDGAGLARVRSDVHFASNTASFGDPSMTVCAASHIVGGEIGDPYTVSPDTTTA